MVENLPAVNALLNSIATVLLLVGYVQIRRKNVAGHKFCMLSAVVVSAAFLACYLVYHYHAGRKEFPGPSHWAIVYRLVLYPHIVLAAVMVPMILMTLWRAFRGNFEGHRKIARVTFPIWIYVSITGVLIYLMLYKINWN